MGNEIESIKPLATKPLKSYDTNGDGKIKKEELTIFKEDCKALFKAAYGENSPQAKNLCSRIDKTEIFFGQFDEMGSTNRYQADFEKQKYTVALSSGPKSNVKDSNGNKVSKKLENNKYNLTDIAGILIHELEHNQQWQYIYDKTKQETGSIKMAARSLSKIESGKNETFCEIERLNFYKKLGTSTIPATNSTYLSYKKALNGENISPDSNKKEFFEKFNLEEFETEVKTRYKYLDFNDYPQIQEIKNLVGE